ncbi:MAG: thioredoxin family protein [Candidatus Rokubacteria bacterium]|nr:thioredoxin family protein [Candidatus Rokubacteria bacterium]
MVADLLAEARNALPDLHVEEIDVTRRPDVAVRYRVMSTPAIAINGRLEFSGVPRKDALLARLRAAADAVDDA